MCLIQKDVTFCLLSDTICKFCGRQTAHPTHGFSIRWIASTRRVLLSSPEQFAVTSQRVQSTLSPSTTTVSPVCGGADERTCAQKKDPALTLVSPRVGAGLISDLSRQIQ